MTERVRPHPLDDQRLVNTEGAAGYLDLPSPTLISWRHLRRGPPYIRLGRLIRYRVQDLQAFVEQGRQVSEPALTTIDIAQGGNTAFDKLALLARVAAQQERDHD